MTAPTVGKTMEAFMKLGVVREVTGRKRGRVFAYGRYLALIGEETEEA